MTPRTRTLFAVCTIVLAVPLTVSSHPSAASPVIPLRDDRVAAFEGTWVGRDNPTPVGPLDFALDFVRQADGSLRAHTAFSKETWVDLHFRKESGSWVLHESAALSGLGVQAYPMHPVRAARDTVEWAYLEDPGHLTARTAVSKDELYMQVFVRGKQHVLFRLGRATGETAAAVRLEQESARERTGGDDMARLNKAGGGDDPLPVRNARAKAVALPREAAAHVELGDAIGAVIGGAPPQKLGAYAQEMLGAYQTAVTLDSTSVGAHFGLSQYYLEAPTIAGGSLDKAAVEAAVLGRIGSPLSEVVVAQVEARRGQREAALQRLRGVIERHPDLGFARQVLLKLSGEGGHPSDR